MSSCTLWADDRDDAPKQREGQAMKIGYIRVSKDKQATILQEDAMKREESSMEKSKDKASTFLFPSTLKNEAFRSQ
jgi:hypothetical protein